MHVDIKYNYTHARKKKQNTQITHHHKKSNSNSKYHLNSEMRHLSNNKKIMSHKNGINNGALSQIDPTDMKQHNHLLLRGSLNSQQE